MVYITLWEDAEILYFSGGKENLEEMIQLSISYILHTAFFPELWVSEACAILDASLFSL